MEKTRLTLFAQALGLAINTATHIGLALLYLLGWLLIIPAFVLGMLWCVIVIFFTCGNDGAATIMAKHLKLLDRRRKEQKQIPDNPINN